jgi:Cellulase (glycosyl hydrolase family 5)
MRLFFLLSLLCCSIIGSAFSKLSALEVVVLNEQPAADDLVEWEIRGADAGWLTYDVSNTPQLLITSPNNRTWQRAAFLYRAGERSTDNAPAQLVGDPVLRIRHTPRIAGEHRWKLTTPKGAELANGVLKVDKPKGPYPVGMLKIAKENPRLLAFTDGTIFIPIGPNLCWANPPRQSEKFAEWMDLLQKESCNHIRLWCASWCGQIEGEEPDNYRLDHAWLLDDILASARKHGLKVSMVLDNHHDVKEGKSFPYGTSEPERLKNFMGVPLNGQYMRRIRYMLARYGADDTIAMWELMNEIDLAQPKRELSVKWATAAADALKSADIDTRLITASWSGDDFEAIGRIPAIQLTNLHNYVLEWTKADDKAKQRTRDGVDMLMSNAVIAQTFGKPFCFSEVGFQGTNQQNEGNNKDQQGLLLRQQAWAGFLLGGYGSGMNWWWDTYLEPQKLWKIYGSMAKLVSKIDWRDAELIPLTPNTGSPLRVIGWQSKTQALLWPQVRADTWHASLVGGKGRAQLTVDQTIRLRDLKSNMAFRVHYFDMVSAEERAVREIKSDPSGTASVVVMQPNVDVILWLEQVK